MGYPGTGHTGSRRRLVLELFLRRAAQYAHANNRLPPGIRSGNHRSYLALSDGEEMLKKSLSDLFILVTTCIHQKL
jgi:hypothetical protein